MWIIDDQGNMTDIVEMINRISELEKEVDRLTEELEKVNRKLWIETGAIK
jgi:vacuolar-type H+-ATPase subunit D/Vma8